MSSTRFPSDPPGTADNTDSGSVVRLFHNPGCSKSRGALELLSALTAEQNLTLEVIAYLETPPDRQQLVRLLELLPNAPAELVRRDKQFQALNLNPADCTRKEQVIDLLLQHPELMQRPIALYQGRAAIGRPPENLMRLFT